MRTASIDRQLIIVSLCLVLFGLATLYSAGQTDVPTRAAGVWYRQFMWFGVGIVAIWIIFHVSMRVLEWVAPAVYAFSILLLVVVLMVGTGVGTAVGSHSWLAVGGHQIGQPSELAKVATVLMLARFLSSRKEPPRSLRDLIGPVLIVGVPCLLVLKQPDLGSALVFVGIFFAMLFWSGVRPRMLFMLATPVVSLLLAFNTLAWSVWIILFVLILIAWRPYVWDWVVFLTANLVMGAIAMPLWKRLAPYQQNRLLTFLDPEADPRAAGYHAIQSRVAIGSGGWFGTGYTEGPQKRLAFLPEQHTDFVFSVVGEELGFVGVLVALSLFLALFLVLIRIARRATDSFSSLAVFGIVGLFFTHVFENVGMTVNLMPITGIPLPLFSYGGSFFIICSLCLGVALRVAWDSRLSGYADS
ncbi:MAG TPA: rod shape-determining protein RodA [Gemmatimonadales bacterium]|jgi:rod shape determining protein RodA|nr:rod shape-determining protein RodA [Gemmatimonadales bacterium]